MGEIMAVALAAISGFVIGVFCAVWVLFREDPNSIGGNDED